ncbi:hypothetical protein JAAARDRAFT_62420 [Jaapia argillacea MUCL 33604]|uniref:Uncharacterized protein n=1 Tax=Jaapia argillacea MUCL 33604 TaxID=933084 RepID=A0A067PKK2_9AGAM|nr:hypothetical protein JAAARDRAFT_62420 [Jaapia argillacea MUCL 33604]
MPLLSIERALDFRATTFPLNDDQTQRAIQLYHDLKDGGPSAYPILAWHIARVMTIIEESRDIALYGTMDSRLYRDVAIPKPTRTVQVMDLLLMFFLFGAHRMYRRRLQAAAPKKNVHQFEFQKLMRSFLLEWAGQANVAFLAIPNINGLQKTASLASSLFSLTSIAAGVHHVWQHRGKDAVQREESAQYMKHMDSVSEEHGLTVLSCFLALPIVCLLWSILCFTVAVSALCFQSSGRVAQSLLGTGLGILGMFVAWTLVVFWRIWKDKPTAEIGKDLNNEDMGWREGFPAKFGRWKMKVKGWIPAVTGRSAAEPVEKSSDAGSGSLSA